MEHRGNKAVLVPFLPPVLAVSGGGRTIVQDNGPPRPEHKTTVAMVPHNRKLQLAL